MLLARLICSRAFDVMPPRARFSFIGVDAAIDISMLLLLFSSYMRYEAHTPYFAEMRA